MFHISSLLHILSHDNDMFKLHFFIVAITCQILPSRFFPLGGEELPPNYAKFFLAE